MRTILALFLFTGLAIYPCQAQFNKYKYFIVPKRFEIFKETNQYQTSTLVKFLLTKYGYEALYDDAIPEELFWDKCLGVTAQLEDNSSYLRTNIAIVFMDCKGREVYRTPEGSSKIKEYKEAYAESIQEAMEVMAILKYEYDGPEPAASPEAETVPFNEEVPDAVEEKTPPPAAETAVAAETLEDESLPIGSVEEKVLDEDASLVWSEAINQNGYIVSHLTSGESWVMLRTSNDEVYLAYSQNKQGVGFQVASGWRVEYYLGEELQQILIQTRDQ